MQTNVDWNFLLDEHGPLVARISWRLLGNAADVEDNVQETFLQAFQLAQRQHVSHWRGLLRRVATCTALARLRRRRADMPLGAAAVACRQPAPDDEAAERELGQRLRREVARLPEREAVVFSLRYFEDLSLAEIAATLGIGYAAAGTALSRARSKLERKFCPGLEESSR